MQKKSYTIYTLGCKVNQYESGKLSRELTALGFESARENADLAIINTCCVTKSAIRKCRSMINKAGSENKNARLVITGCWPKIYAIDNKKYAADLIWRKGNNSALIKKVASLMEIAPIANSKRASMARTNRARYTIKIQDGCEQFCSYCIIPYARGRIKSRPMDEVLKEIKKAMESGYNEIILSGIHLGQYGREKANKNINLLNLLKKIIKIRALGRVRLSSIEINEVNAPLIKLIAENRGKICRHLHIPLQSGSNKILKLMKRPYSLGYYKNKIAKIRQAMPEIAISTDIIVGFPGETEKDFNDTYNFVKKIKFSRLHVFPFSAHKKTPAYNFPNQIEKDIILQRAKKIRLLGLKFKEEYKKKFKNKKLSVVVENVSQGIYTGKTEYYFDIKFKRGRIMNNDKLPRNLIKKLVKVK